MAVNHAALVGSVVVLEPGAAAHMLSTGAIEDVEDLSNEQRNARRAEIYQAWKDPPRTPLSAHRDDRVRSSFNNNH